MFKIADKHLAQLGFAKTRDDEYGAEYKRVNEKYGFTQILSILHKESGKHIVQSYDRDLFDSKHIGNVCVGLTASEMKWAYRKMKEIGLG